LRWTLWSQIIPFKTCGAGNLPIWDKRGIVIFSLFYTLNSTIIELATSLIIILSWYVLTTNGCCFIFNKNKYLVVEFLLVIKIPINYITIKVYHHHTGKCLKPEHAVPKSRTPSKTCVSLPRSIFLWSWSLKTINLSITTKTCCSANGIS